MLERLTRVLFLLTLFLLPWGGLLRVRALHEHAQWSDLAFAVCVATGLAGCLVSRRLPKLRLVYIGIAFYLGWAALSLLRALPRPASGPAKLLGMGMLAALFVLTAEMMKRSGMPEAIGRTVAASALLASLASAAGVALSSFGVETPLVGGCGDLVPGPYLRAQAGFPHPNLLASYCVFALGVVAREDAGLSRRLRRLTLIAIALTVVLAVSRAFLGVVLFLAIRRADTPPRRRAAWAVAALLGFVMGALSVSNPVLDPLRPWQTRLSSAPGPRYLAATSSFETWRRHPLLGLGPGSSPGWRGGEAFDAHLTPLNIAATLGLPALAAVVFLVFVLWRRRRRPTDRVTWGMLAGLALDGLGQDVEDFRHVWIALGMADAGRREDRD